MTGRISPCTRCGWDAETIIGNHQRCYRCNPKAKAHLPKEMGRYRCLDCLEWGDYEVEKVAAGGRCEELAKNLGTMDFHVCNGPLLRK